MNAQTDWQWDESVQVGTDYADPAQVAAYEARMERMLAQHPGQEQASLKLIGMAPSETLVDIGAGTGFFALQAARCYHKVYAVDVSSAMLDVARRKAEEMGIDNVEFHQAGFLTYQHKGEPVDAVVSQAALHHLPDAWKYIALSRIAGMLKAGGRLLLRDVVFRFEPAQYRQAFERMVYTLAQDFREEEMGRQIETHIRQEFSTWDWIMEGMLRRTGFRVEMADYRNGLATYLCTKSRR